MKNCISSTFSTPSDPGAGWIPLETATFHSSGMTGRRGFDWKTGLIWEKQKKKKGGGSICFIGAPDWFQCAANFLESPASRDSEITSQLMNK